MRKLLMLGLLLWGNGGAGAQSAWTAVGGALVRFTSGGGSTALQYAAPAPAGLEDTLLELSTTTDGTTMNGNPTLCTKWVYVGILSGSVVIQTYRGEGGGAASQLQINEALGKKNPAAGAAFAASLCRGADLTPVRTLYVPLNTPLAITEGLTLMLKTNATGQVIATVK